jgi:pimeloyl-ACP methyl ester carboxylesterase
VWSIEEIVNVLFYDESARYNRTVGNLMDRAVLDGIELEYVVRGGAEPVVLIHPGIFADWLVPLLDEPILTSQYRLLHDHRAGCAGSGHVNGPASFAEHAGHCRALGSLELDRIWSERQQLLLDWLPNVEPFVLPNATHLLQIDNPRGMAEGLARFFARHPLTVAA